MSYGFQSCSIKPTATWTEKNLLHQQQQWVSWQLRARCCLWACKHNFPRWKRINGPKKVKIRPWTYPSPGLYLSSSLFLKCLFLHLFSGKIWLSFQGPTRMTFPLTPLIWLSQSLSSAPSSTEFVLSNWSRGCYLHVCLGCWIIREKDLDSSFHAKHSGLCLKPERHSHVYLMKPKIQDQI